MKINSDGDVVLTLIDIMDQMPPEALLETIESLSCAEAVIKHVADQLLEGWTENGYHGSMDCSSIEPDCAINVARARIEKAADKLAVDRIAELERTCKHLKESGQLGWDAYHKLNDRGSW